MSPVYGLAECSVGLAFTPPGTPWQMDTLDREQFSRTGEAVAAREDDPAPLKVVACGRAIPDHEMRVVDAAASSCPTAPRARCSSAARRRRAAITATPRPRASSSTANG